MKNIIVFAFFAAFVAFSWPALGLPVRDVQANTRCDLSGYCETKVDLSAFLTANQINVVRSLNLSAKLPKLANVSGMSITLVNSTLKINGTVPLGSSNYWTYDLGTYVTLDPWWNSTFRQCQNITLACTDGRTFWLNLTKQSGMDSNYADLRFVNNSCNNNNAIELNHWDEAYKATEWHGYVTLDAECTNRVISVYYNNSSIVTTTSTNNTFLNGWDYDKNTVPTATCRNGGAWATQATYRYNDSASAYGSNMTKSGSWEECYYDIADIATSTKAVYVWYLYGRNVANSFYGGVMSGAAGDSALQFRIVTAGVLDYWNGGAYVPSGLSLSDALWNKLQATGSSDLNSWNVTLWNRSGTYTVSGLTGTDTGKVVTHIADGKYDSTPLNVYGDAMFVYSYNSTPILYTIGAVEEIPPGNVALYLNSVRGNASGYGTLNSTAVMAGYNLTLLINGSAQYGYSPLTNVTTLGLGKWNITGAWAGNASLVKNQTTYWWTQTLAPNYPLDTHLCFSIKDVCVDTLSGRVWIGGRPQ